MANWLITGGCGFIGSALIHKILSDSSKHSIRVVDNLSVGSPNALSGLDYSLVESTEIKSWANNKVLIYKENILNEEFALEICNEATYIVHLAANTGVGPSVENPRMDCVTNVMGIFNYLEAARINAVERFIFASSGAPVGEVTPPIHEEIVPHPVSPYGASKLCGEAYCSAYAKSFGVETVALRFGNVYGPGSAHKSSVVAKFMNEILTGQELTIYGDGNQTRDYIYLEDLIRAVILSTTVDNIGGEIFQIATNKETTLNELTDMIASILGEKGYTMPKVNFTAQRVGDVMRNYSDTSKAKNMLNWEQSITLDKGLKSTFEYFLEIRK